MWVTARRIFWEVDGPSVRQLSPTPTSGNSAYTWNLDYDAWTTKWTLSWMSSTLGLFLGFVRRSRCPGKSNSKRPVRSICSNLPYLWLIKEQSPLRLKGVASWLSYTLRCNILFYIILTGSSYEPYLSYLSWLFPFHFSFSIDRRCTSFSNLLC